MNKEESDILNQLLFSNQSVDDTFHPSNNTFNSESLKIDYEIDQHIKKMKQFKAQKSEQINRNYDSTDTTENLLHYLASSKSPPKNQMHSRSPLKASSHYSIANGDDESTLASKVQDLKASLKQQQIPLFGNLLNPANLNQSVNQTLQCIQHLLSLVLQYKHQFNKQSETVARVQSDNQALLNRNQDQEQLIKDLKEKLKGTRMNVKNAIEKQYVEKDQFKEKDREQKSTLSKIEQRLNVLIHDNKKLSNEKQRLQEKVQYLLDNKTNVIKGSSIETSGKALNANKQEFKDVKFEFLEMLKSGYERQIEAINGENAKLKAQVEQFKLGINKIWDKKVGNLKDAGDVKLFMEQFADAVRNSYQRTSSPARKSPSPVKKQVSPQRPEVRQEEVEEDEMQARQMQFEKDKWKKYLSGQTIVFE